MNNTVFPVSQKISVYQLSDDVIEMCACDGFTKVNATLWLSVSSEVVHNSRYFHRCQTMQLQINRLLTLSPSSIDFGSVPSAASARALWGMLVYAPLGLRSCPFNPRPVDNELFNKTGY